MKINFKVKSIRFRIWLYFLGFTALVLVLMWFLQIFFLNNYYEEMKVRETKETAYRIAASYESGGSAAMYHRLLEGSLPIHLQFIKADNDKVIQRFYKACVGWIRYKPLLLYITNRDGFDEEIASMKKKLQAVLPKVSAYFNRPEFMTILPELEKYQRNVGKHYKDFLETQEIWAKVMEHLTQK